PTGSTARTRGDRPHWARGRRALPRPRRCARRGRRWAASPPRRRVPTPAGRPLRGLPGSRASYCISDDRESTAVLRAYQSTHWTVTANAPSSSSLPSTTISHSLSPIVVTSTTSRLLPSFTHISQSGTALDSVGHALPETFITA